MRYLVTLLALSVLSACAAAVPIGSPGADPSPTILGEGEMPSNEILIYRPAEVGFVTNVATAPAILLDGRPIGTCRIGQPIVLRVPAGTWTISALGQSGEIVREVSVRDGARASLRCGTTADPFKPAPTLVMVDAVTGFEEAGL